MLFVISVSPILARAQQPTPIEQLTIYTSCVLAVRYYGANVPLGNADTLRANSYPTIGGVIILKYWSEKTQTWIYHLAYIKSFTKDGYEILEGNYYAGKLSRRIIGFNSKDIVGFWSEDMLK